MNIILKFVLILVVTALAASSAFFFFPAVKAEDLSLVLAIAFASSITQLVAVWYFLSSLKAFKKGLRIAYVLLAVGILLFSLTQLIPSLSAFSDVIAGNVIVAGLAFIAPYTFGALLMYLGMRKFAKLLEIHFLWRSFWFALVFAVCVTTVFVLLPHLPVADVDEATLDLLFGLAAWCGSFSVAATALAIRIRQAIGVLYKNALTWLAVALGALVFGAFHEVIVKMYFLDSSYVISQLSVWPLLLVGVLFLRAGLSFKETEREFVQLPADASYVDIVIGLAHMVSKPAEIDAALDKVRAITSNQDSRAELSAANQELLLDAYVYIEDYLTTTEPLHTFTKEGLRNGLPDSFLKSLAGRTSSNAA